MTMREGVETKVALIAALDEVADAVSAAVEAMAPAQFTEGNAEAWSAADYLKHLILSVKPTAKAFEIPSDRLVKMFGVPEHTPRDYATIAALYTTRLAEGVRAEDAPSVMPTGYRMPDEVTDEKGYLLATWRESNQRLVKAVDALDEIDLDRHQLPHPAIGMVTFREMLLFTIHHNTMHSRDIQARAV